MDTLPMFPLGVVLFPGGVLPLHVFEPRYRALVEHCLAGEREFGVVLIERGSEVGGGDVRSGVGVVARIVETADLPGGRYAVVAVGTRRIRVERWLPDDPYPQAEVHDWPDDDPDVGAEAVLAVVNRLRRVLALKAEAGDAVADATTEVAADTLLASYHAATLAPLGPADQYRLLAAAGPTERAALLDDLLGEEEEVLRLRLAGGSTSA
jgi:Lon protease-like protein